MGTCQVCGYEANVEFGRCVGTAQCGLNRSADSIRQQHAKSGDYYDRQRAGVQKRDAKRSTQAFAEPAEAIGMVPPVVIDIEDDDGGVATFSTDDE